MRSRCQWKTKEYWIERTLTLTPDAILFVNKAVKNSLFLFPFRSWPNIGFLLIGKITTADRDVAGNLQQQQPKVANSKSTGRWSPREQLVGFMARSTSNSRWRWVWFQPIYLPTELKSCFLVDDQQVDPDWDWFIDRLLTRLDVLGWVHCNIIC